MLETEERKGGGEERKERREKRTGYVLSLQKTSTNVEGMIQLEKLHLYQLLERIISGC